MRSYDITIGIWWKAILINAFLISAWMVFFMGIAVVLMCGALIVVGFIITLPLLPLVQMLLIAQRSLTGYRNAARLVWFCFMMACLIWSLYYFLIWFIGGGFNTDGVFYAAMSASSSVAIFLSVSIHKSSIYYLNDEFTEGERLDNTQSPTHV